MGQAVSCCTQREDDDRRPNSYVGDDIFFEAEEGGLAADHLFVQRASVVGHYAAHTAQQQIPCVVRRPSSLDVDSSPRPVDAGEKAFPGDWLGRTSQPWTGEARLPPPEGGTCWSQGLGRGLRARGPQPGGGKVAMHGSLYECISMDFVRARCKIEDILERLVAVPDKGVTTVSAGDQGGGGTLRWSAGCPLPRIICVNLMLPYEAGPKLFGEHPASDHGASCVAIFAVRPETLRLLQAPESAQPPCVKLFKEFVAGPCGSPGGRRDHPGLFKAIAQADNLESLGLPIFLHKFNGKPALISKSGYVVKAPSGEWLELGADMRLFSPLARDALVRFRELVPKASLHFGFLIQGVEAEELPEGLLGDVRVHYLDLLRGPVLIDDPRAAGGK